MKPETRFQTKFLKLLKELPNTWYVKVSQKTISGTPDIIACVRGTFIAIELKASLKSNMSKLQYYESDRICEAHGLFYICCPENHEVVINDLKMIAYGPNKA